MSHPRCMKEILLIFLIFCFLNQKKATCLIITLNISPLKKSASKNSLCNEAECGFYSLSMTMYLRRCAEAEPSSFSKVQSSSTASTIYTISGRWFRVLLVTPPLCEAWCCKRSPKILQGQCILPSPSHCPEVVKSL